MRNLIITVSMLLLAAGAGWAGDKGFHATLKKIEGNKITLVRHAGASKEETLIAADDCRLLEQRPNYRTGSFEMIPVERGLKGDIDAKAFVTAEIVTGRDNKIVEIRGADVWWSGGLQRFQAVFKKIDDDKVEMYKVRGGLEEKLAVTPDCKVWEARYGGEGSPLVTTPVAGGLKAEVFKERMRVLIVADAKNNLLELGILRPNPHVFEGSVTKIEGDKLTLVKWLPEGRKGREETISAAAHCDVVEYQIDRGLAKALKVPFEPGPRSEFLTMKRMELRFHTDKEHKVTRIIVFHNPHLQTAIVRMDRLDSVRVFTATKEKKVKKTKKEKVDTFFPLADGCRILQGRVDRETATATYELVKGGIKAATVPTRPFRALLMQNDAGKVIEMRIVKDPANFATFVSKVEQNAAGEWVLSVMEPALSIPGSEARGTYHNDFVVSKDCRVFKRSGGKGSLEPVEGNNLLTLRPRDRVKGGPAFVVARILLGRDGKVAEVQILEGVTSVE
ncbi:MAG: hypothetical protein U0793_05040 [Gemmataceae bacterium]